MADDPSLGCSGTHQEYVQAWPREQHVLREHYLDFIFKKNQPCDTLLVLPVKTATTTFEKQMLLNPDPVWL